MNTILLFITVLVAGLMGCASNPDAPIEFNTPAYDVSFPEIKLADHEYLESIEVNIKSGHVVSINRLPYDWDSRLEWDNPEEIFYRAQAGHFPAGLSNLTELKNFITVQGNHRGGFIITGKLVISVPDLTGKPDRTIDIGEKEMVLKRVWGRFGHH